MRYSNCGKETRPGQTFACIVEEILKEAYNLVTTCKCEKGCPNCLWSYWRKRDIPKINKTLILNPLATLSQISTDGLINEEEILKELKKEFHCGNTRTIITNKLDGSMSVKKALLNARDEVYITSLYVTDDKIQWPDGRRESWVDILSFLALKGIKVHLIVRNPTSDKHRSALKRLKDNGVNVYIYEKPIENYKLKGIVHAKLIVVDPFKDTRRVIFTSANLSPEVTKNVDFYIVSEEEKCVKHTLQRVNELLMESRKYQ